MFSVIIKNATIIDPNSPYNSLTKDILIKDGTIIKIENDISDKNTNQISKENLHICPGLFDFSVDFPEP